MQEVTLISLDARLQKQIENAQVALQRGNFDYVVEITTTVLAQEPGCVPVRRLQRAALLRRAETKNKLMSKAMGSVTMAGFMFASKKDPAKAFENADKMLHADPSNVGALKAFGEAAKALGLLETSAFAWESIRALQPKDHDTLVALANAYIDARMHKDAVRVAEDLLKLRPQDGDALSLMRKASVAQTMDKGNWESQASFRNKLKDENLAVSLEQAAKVVTSAEMTEKLIDEAKDRLAQQPDNLNHFRTIIEGYRRIEDSALALEFVKKARLLPAAAGDATLEKLQGDLTILVIDKRVKALAAQSDAAPEDAALKQAADAAREELAKAKLEDARTYVERYPNDYAARFTLGSLLYDGGDFQNAIANFQQALKSPKVRIASLGGMGKALKARKMFDLAVQQFQTAKSELPTMDDLKKDVIYQLAECYEGMGKREDAITEYKLIYSEDIGFRDVADKINAFYSAS